MFVSKERVGKHEVFVVGRRVRLLKNPYAGSVSAGGTGWRLAFADLSLSARRRWISWTRVNNFAESFSVAANSQSSIHFFSDSMTKRCIAEPAFSVLRAAQSALAYKS